MLNIIIDYFGHSIYPIVLIVLISYLLFRVWKEKSVVDIAMLVGMAAFILLFPALYFVCSKIGQEAECYRFFWLIPLNLVMAYLVINLWKHENFNKESGMILLFLTAALFGSVLNQRSIIKAPDHLNAIPKEVTEVCDAINADCERNEVRVVGEPEFMIGMRQYASNLCWAYTGRGQMMQAQTDELNESFFDDPQYRIAMAVGQNQYIREDNLFEDFKTLDTQYVVVSNENDIRNHFFEDSFELLIETNGYAIYKVK